MVILPIENISFDRKEADVKNLPGIILCVIILGMFQPVLGQKQITNVQQVWGGFFNQTRLSDKWGLWADVHLRTKEDFVTDLSTAIFRAGITYLVNDHLRFTAGYAYVNHFPADAHPGVSQPEHRPWQQLLWNVPGKRTRLLHVLRLEERYRRKILDEDELAEGYSFNFRMRYNLMAMFAMGEKAFAPNTISFLVNDEVMVNMGKEIVYNYFDQNRFFVGFAYHIDAHNNVQFGYMNVFQQTAAGDRYRSIHVPRIFYFNTIDLRKNRKK